MTEDRRYRDDEVRQIFGLAARGKIAEPPARTAADGLTLADIQEIGKEVGLEPTAVASAAASLDVRSDILEPRKSLGMPIEVGRTIPLPRQLTDTEWDQLVVELRSTFGARGKVTSQGGLKEWSNGNLHACIEPAGSGYRLRLGTVKGNANVANALGAAGLTAGAIAVGALLLRGGPMEAVFGPAMMGVAGIGAFLFNMVRLPRWANQRDKQMEYIAGRIPSIVKDA